MIRFGLLLLFLPIAAQAQLQLTIINGSQKTPVSSGQTVSLGAFAPGTTVNFVIQATNSASAPVAIPANSPSLSGAGFSVTSISPTTPVTIAPGSSLNTFVQFSAATPAAYSASFSLGSNSIVLVATIQAAAALSSSSPCTGPGNGNSISFGNIAFSQTVTCTITLLNQSSQALTISSVSVSGQGFLLAQPVSTPANLITGGASQLQISFSPNAAQIYSGALTIGYPALSQTFTLNGTAYSPPLPTPILEFDTANPQSGQQITLTMALPVPSPILASGSVNMAFTPNPETPASATDDIGFANGAKAVNFTIQPGSTQAMLNGQAGAVFSTGTTAGKITFTVSTGAQLTGDPTTSVTLAPIPISVDNVAATAIAGDLNVQIWGFDNTYSAGPMSFTFYDAAGNPIGSGPISADFTPNFKTYFSSSTDGGSFAVVVTFPITGNAAEVGSVNVQMTNSIGSANITGLAFLNDTGTCVLVNNVLTCPPAPTQ